MGMAPKHIHVRRLVPALMGSVLLSTGCANSIHAECERPAGARADFGDFHSVPRPRMGALPFPGVFTLYTSAGEDLGSHSYSTWGSGGEVHRGIVYTCDAGFLDISHIRNAADMTAYLHARTHRALLSGWTCFRFRGKEPSHYEVQLTYPEGWDAMDPAERADVIDEAAVRVAQRLALTVMTWHELLTWYGYKSAVVVSEKPSAFTYDDGPSHALGVLLAGDVLRAGHDFDTGVTDYLHASMSELGMVEQSRLHEAAMAVKGDWWSYGSPIRRHLETGLESGTDDTDAYGVVTPWLVPGIDFCADSAPTVFEIPTLADVGGHDLSRLVRVEIDPRVFESGRIFARLPDATRRVDPDRDFPLLIADIRNEIGEEFTRVEQPTATETAAHGQ